MARLIDADALASQIRQEPTDGMFTEEVLEVIDESPTIEAAPVVHGRWIKDGEVVGCSECGEEHGWSEYRATYCEDCGARMDGDGNA